MNSTLSSNVGYIIQMIMFVPKLNTVPIDKLYPSLGL